MTTSRSLAQAPLAMHASVSLSRIADGGFVAAATPSYRDDLCPLDNILERIDRSNSWAYKSGLVPMFDKQGQKIKSTKIPPWPWEVLPDPIVKVGKKAWTTCSVDSWLARMNARVNHAEKTATHSNREYGHA